MTDLRSLAPVAAVPVAVHAGLLAVGDLAAHPLATLLLLAVGTAALVPAARRLGGLPVSTAGSVLLVAALLRLLLVPLPATLSDDLGRYVWDGRVAAAGFDPYRLAPEADELAGLRDELWTMLPHRDVPTVYPPLAMGLFSIAARLPRPALALKGSFALLDLATCALLLVAAARLGVGGHRAVWYAWHPLAALETAGMGHVDALGVAAVAATVALLVSRPRWAAAAVTAAAAALAKLVPLVAFAAWARSSGRPWRFALLAAALFAALFVPLAAASGVPPGLVTYGVSWEFNGPLYEPLWRLLDRAGTREAVESLLDRLKLWHGDHELWNRFYPWNYPRLQAKLLLGALLAALVVRASLGRRVVESSGRIFGAVVLCSATVYPWYLLWVLPWAALCRQPAWLALSATLPLAYLPQTLGVPLWPWVWLAIWLPFAILLVRNPRWSTG